MMMLMSSQSNLRIINSTNLQSVCLQLPLEIDMTTMTVLQDQGRTQFIPPLE